MAEQNANKTIEVDERDFTRLLIALGMYVGERGTVASTDLFTEIIRKYFTHHLTEKRAKHLARELLDEITFYSTDNGDVEIADMYNSITKILEAYKDWLG